MKTVLKVCLYCKQEFQASLKELKRGDARFCSRSCGQKGKPHPKTGKRITLECAICKVNFERLEDKLSNSRHGVYFCSRKCKDIGQRIESGIKVIQPPHYGEHNGKSSYRQLAFRAYPASCNYCGYNKYSGILRVHHVDRNRDNNLLENLEILCPNCHEEEHFVSHDGLYHNNKNFNHGLVV